jgi:hypothetical protein
MCVLLCVLLVAVVVMMWLGSACTTWVDREITTVVRGEEWLPSAPKHILLYNALGWPVPAWAHLPLLLGSDGGKLSKRRGNAASVAELREAGYLPSALIHSLVLCGWAPPEKDTPAASEAKGRGKGRSKGQADQDQKLLTLETLSSSSSSSSDDGEDDDGHGSFSLERVQRAAARLDPVKLGVLNGRHLRAQLRQIYPDPESEGGAEVSEDDHAAAAATAAAEEKLLASLRPVFSRAVLRATGDSSGNADATTTTTAVLPLAIAQALARRIPASQAEDAVLRPDGRGELAVPEEVSALLMGGVLDDYLLEVTRLLQKHANGPLSELADHAGYFFGHLPQISPAAAAVAAAAAAATPVAPAADSPPPALLLFKCKDALRPAVVTTMLAMATELESLQRHDHSDDNGSAPAGMLGGDDAADQGVGTVAVMKSALQSALARWNEAEEEEANSREENGAGAEKDDEGQQPPQQRVVLKQGQFMPQVRMAVTGHGSGADLLPALSLLGAECVASRLRLGAAALQRQQAASASASTQ